MNSHLLNIEEVSNTRRKFKFSVPSPVVKEAYEKEANTLQTTAEVRGFRKGKAPLSLIKKFYISDIVKKAADKVINDTYSEALKTVDFQIVSAPEVEPEGSFDENLPFNFSASVDINPKVDIQNYKGLGIKLDTALNVNANQEFEKTLAQYARVLGTTAPVTDRGIIDGDRVAVDYVVTSANEQLNGKEVKNSKLEIEANLLPEFKKALMGLKAGDETTFTVNYPANYPEPMYAGQSCDYKMTVLTVESVTAAELNDELAQKIGFKNSEELHTRLKSDIETSLADSRVNAAFEQVVDHLLATNSFDVADSLIDSTVERMVQESKNQNQAATQSDADLRASLRDSAIKQVKGILALGHIARQENIVVSDEELIQEISQFARLNRIAPQELYKKLGNRMYDEFRGQAMVRKVVSFILDQASVSYTAAN